VADGLTTDNVDVAMTSQVIIVVLQIVKTRSMLVHVVLFGVGLVIEKSLVRLPAGALSSQLSLPSLRGR